MMRAAWPSLVVIAAIIVAVGGSAAFDVVVFVGVCIGIAYGVRWAWHQGAPRSRAALRAWWDAGRD